MIVSVTALITAPLNPASSKYLTPTIVGVRYLEEAGFRGAVIKAVTETIKKSKEMSLKNNNN